MKKNVLIFTHNYATQFVDICNQYTKLFDKDRYEVTVAYLSGEPDEKIRQKTLAEKVIFINCSKKSIRGLKLSAIKKMLQLCREKKFEIVICQRYKPIYVMLWVAQFCRIPALFFVMHELGTLNHLSRKLLIAALAKDNMIFAGVSNAVRDDMRKDIWRVPSERVITLYNMIDIDLTEPNILDRQTARQKLNLSENDFVFGNIGRLAKNKDQKTLINAFAAIKPKCPNAKLVIIGDGQLESELKNQVNTLGLIHDVMFTGFIPDSFHLIKAFDVYISSSIQEAFGRVLIEAMVARTPIIATRVNGVPEVVGDSGTLIKAADTQVLASAMLDAYALTPEDRMRCGEKVYQRAVNDFSLQRFNEIFWQLPIIQNRIQKGK